MFRAALLALACLVLAGCATTTAPATASGCIPGDPSGPLHCQHLTYLLAF